MRLRDLPDQSSGTEMQGPMLDLLPPIRPTHEQRAVAAALLAVASAQNT
jgi:hypothetical protein